jgi:homoserine O-acetyltransferase/O-succinyltransferase
MLDNLTTRLLANLDPCDMVYAFEASRNYNPAPMLLQIVAPLTAVNSADDQVNPPELFELEKGVERLQQAGRDARAVVLPVSAETRGHGSHTIAALWQDELDALLQRAKAARAGTQDGDDSVSGPRL